MRNALWRSMVYFLDLKLISNSFKSTSAIGVCRRRVLWVFGSVYVVMMMMMIVWWEEILSCTQQQHARIRTVEEERNYSVNMFLIC